MQATSRYERRELRRQEQRGAEAASNRKRLLRRLVIWVVSLAIIGGLGWLVFRSAQNVQLPSQSGNLVIPVSAIDHVFGSTDAPMTLVEYSDYQCPACGSYYPLIKQVLADSSLQGQVRFVYRNFPLTQIHANAQLAAQAAEAASLQNKFWEYHDLLFENQKKWSEMSAKGAREQFVAYAKQLGLDTARFEKDIDSAAVRDRITADLNGGLAAGVNGTPTFFVNGIRMPAPENYDQFRNYIAHGVQ